MNDRCVEVDRVRRPHSGLEVQYQARDHETSDSVQDRKSQSGSTSYPYRQEDSTHNVPKVAFMALRLRYGHSSITLDVLIQLWIVTGAHWCKDS